MFISLLLSKILVSHKIVLVSDKIVLVSHMYFQFNFGILIPNISKNNVLQIIALCAILSITDIYQRLQIIALSQYRTLCVQ